MNKLDYSGYPALLRGAVYGQVACVKRLILAGADGNI